LSEKRFAIQTNDTLMNMINDRKAREARGGEATDSTNLENYMI
jgi:hypothetical protein